MKDLYCFNPTGEMAIANGMTSYMPPKRLRQFETDLAFLPSFFAQKHDIIISDNKPCESFLETWHQLGLPSLNYLNINEASQIDQLNIIRPWSWSPASHHYLKSLKEKSSIEFKTSSNYQWLQDYKAFFSRASCNKVQSFIMDNTSISDVFIEQAAISLYSLEEIKEWVDKNERAVIKMPWSSSGRGVHTVDKKNSKPLNLEWVKGAIKQQGFVTIEPLLDKVMDYSYQLKLDKNGNIELLGISHFTNDEKGHFTGGIIHWPHQKNELSKFFTKELIFESAKLLIAGIKSILPYKSYEGFIGVDGIIYMHENNRHKLHPCLDINWRYNMGNVNIQLPKFLNDNSRGIWKVTSVKNGQWNNFVEAERKKKPLIIGGSKINSGFIPLTPPSEKAQFGAWMEVFE